MRRVAVRETFIDKAATTNHAGVRVTDFKTCVLSIGGSASCNMKIFVKGAIGDTRPNFTVNPASRAATNNFWDFIDAVDLEDNASIDGDTGVDLSGNNVRLVEVNTNALDWLSVHATAVVAGTVTVAGLFVTNE